MNFSAADRIFRRGPLAALLPGLLPRLLLGLLLGLLALAALFSAWPSMPSISADSQVTNSPPNAVSSVSLSRADGTVTASWNAPSGATKYHVTYNDGTGWQAPVPDHRNIQTTSISFSVDNAKTVVVGVRAGNEHGWSGWVNSPASGPYTPPNSPPADPPAAVASVTLTRADGTATASWDAPSGATKYHVTYNDGSGWQAPVDDHRNVRTTSISFSVDNAKTVVVGVRAGNEHGWSGWVNSAASGPYTPPPPPTPPGIIVQDAGGAALSAISVPEGGEASYQVVLAAAPTEAVEVCIGLAVRDNDDSDISFKGEAVDEVSLKLTFTPTNWDTAQTVTLVAAYDADSLNGARDITHDAREYYSGKVDITATEIDNVTSPAAPSGLTATAGDGSVTLTWGDPSDASITGYEYNVNHNATGTGNLSGWSAWTPIPGSDASTTSHTFSGLTNGREYRYHLRAVNAAGAGAGAPNAAPWFASAVAGLPAPAAPQNLTVEPGEGYLDIAWNAVSGATGYDVRAKTSGSSTWHDVASNVSDTSHRYTTSETIDYVAVRARNAGGTSAWTEKSRLPADDFMNVASGISVGGASIQSGASIQAKLAAPTGFTVMRYETRVTEIDLNWSSVSGATAYNIICSPGQSGWNWHACGWDDSGTVTYTSVPSDQTRPVTTTHYERKAGESRHVPGKYALGYQRAYQVSVRAVNANPDDASPWVESGVIYPIFAALRDFTYTRSLRQITMSWTPNYWTTGYEFDCAAYDLTQTPYVPAYTRCATLTDQDDTDDEHSVTISTWTADGTNYAIDDTKRYDIRICSTNATGRGCTLAPWIDPPSLTASNVAAATATLSIAQWSGSWYYKATSGPHTTCQGPVSGTSQNLTGLASGAPYTYSAYSDSACSTLLATAAQFTTPHPSISNLAGAADSVYCTVHPGSLCFLDFTTGAEGGGYTLTSVTVEFAVPTGTPGNALITLHAVDANNTARPDATALATLSGTSPTTAGQYVFTCSGAGCDLTASTRYFLGFSAASGNSTNLQRVALTTSDAPTLDPANNGWSLGTAVSSRTASGGGGGYTWFSYGSVPKLKLIAKPNTTLTASNVAATTATLTIAHHHAAWYYKHTNTGATCEGPVAAGTSAKALTGLTAGTSYTYSAYSDSTCSTLLATASAFTTTAQLTATSITASGATLTISGHTGQWWYQGGELGEALGSCTSVASGSTATLTGLDSNTLHEYKVYDQANCATADLLTSVRFTTLHSGGGPGFTASNITHHSARLTLSNHTGDWWYQGGSRSGGNGPCTAGPSTFIVDLSSLTASTPYTYSAYSDNRCRSLITSATTVTFDTLDAP